MNITRLGITLYFIASFLHAADETTRSHKIKFICETLQTELPPRMLPLTPSTALTVLTREFAAQEVMKEIDLEPTSNQEQRALQHVNNKGAIKLALALRKIEPEMREELASFIIENPSCCPATLGISCLFCAAACCSGTATTLATAAIAAGIASPILCRSLPAFNKKILTATTTSFSWQARVDQARKVRLAQAPRGAAKMNLTLENSYAVEHIKMKKFD